MKKKLLLASFVIIALSLVFISGVKGGTSSHVNGDALYFKGKVYLATANSGAAVLYQIDNAKITEVATISAIADDSVCLGFIDAVLNIESGGLFMFLTDGKYVYKYDINNPARPVLFNKSNDSTNSRFIGLGKMDNKVYSVSDQGIKIWNDDLEVFYNANLNNPLPHNISFSKKGSFIFNISYDQLEIYDAYSEKLISSIKLKTNDNHERKIYSDEASGTIYLVDDQAVKQIDFSGNVIKSFVHTSTQGYNIAYAPGDDYLYFSDGLGIVKLNKVTLKPVSWAYTKNFSGANGWATDFKVVRDNYGEKIIIFDNNEIIILNQDYKKVGTIKVDDNQAVCLGEENLSLAININQAVAGSAVNLSGRGYTPGENLSIYLGNRKIDSTVADYRGRFTKVITVPQFDANTPEFKPGLMDIKVLGDSSARTYSTNFQIIASIDNSSVPGSAPSVTKKHGLPGEEVVINSLVFNPGEFILIYFDNQKVGSVYADSTGYFSKTIVVPDVTPGKYEINIGPPLGNGYIINFEVDKNYENIFHRTKGCTK